MSQAALSVDKEHLRDRETGSSGLLGTSSFKAEETLDAATKLCKRCCPSTEKSEGCDGFVVICN